VPSPEFETSVPLKKKEVIKSDNMGSVVVVMDIIQATWKERGGLQFEIHLDKKLARSNDMLL
jgi:hypothetical protein